MKTSSTIMLAAALLFVVGGCGSSSSSGSTSDSSGSSSTHHSRRHHSHSGSSSYTGSYTSSSGTSKKHIHLPPSRSLGPRSKSKGCQVHGSLPDKACTPGAVFVGVTAAQICKLGYSKGVRNVSSSTKREAYLEYGITHHSAGEYEVDHLVSLELGGSNSIANLWPEAASAQPGFHEKDQVENYLHDQLCSGRESLSQVQKEIATNWVAVYHRMGH